MKELFLMILLTQNGAGDISASFVNTNTLEECHQKRLVVEGIFNTARIRILESRCTPSNLRFSEFAHAESTRQQRYFYLVNVEEESVEVQSMPNWKQCMEAEQFSTAESKTYCASSIQTVE